MSPNSKAFFNLSDLERGDVQYIQYYADRKTPKLPFWEEELSHKIKMVPIVRA